jgi:hypothetical protein
MTDKPDQMPNPAAVMANRAVLIRNLRFFLLSPNKKKAGHDNITTLQSRYVAALGEVAHFLTAVGEEDLALKFIGLADAIGQLKNGTVADVVRPTPAGGRGPDGIVPWSLRHEVVIGLKCILGKMKTKGKAAKYIADRYPVFDRLKRNPEASLASSILSWRRRIDDGAVPEEAEDILAHERRFFAQYGGENRSPAEMFALGEQLLAQAAERTTRAVF